MFLKCGSALINNCWYIADYSEVFKIKKIITQTVLSKVKNNNNCLSCFIRNLVITLCNNCNKIIFINILKLNKIRYIRKM